MSSNRLLGFVRVAIARLTARWGAFTNDDALKLKASRQRFIGSLEQRTAEQRNQAQVRLDALLAKLDQAHGRRAESTDRSFNVMAPGQPQPGGA